MFPHERSLVKRLEGKPFALLGVNSDEDKDKLKEQNEKQLTITVHPYLEAYLNKNTKFVGNNSVVGQWRKKYKVKLNVNANNNYHIMEYHFFGKNEEEIKI